MIGSKLRTRLARALAPALNTLEEVASSLEQDDNPIDNRADLLQLLQVAGGRLNEARDRLIDDLRERPQLDGAQLEERKA
jgi:hypothetical protein